MPVKGPKRAVRRYDPGSMKSEFIMAGGDAELKAQCV